MSFRNVSEEIKRTKKVLVTGVRQGSVLERVVKRPCVALRGQCPRSADRERAQVPVEGRREGGEGGVGDSMGLMRQTGGRTCGVRLKSKSGSTRYRVLDKGQAPEGYEQVEKRCTVCPQAGMMPTYLA